jgi:folate-binding protein YgfZ
MPTARINDRALVAVAGAEAERFLQNIVTCDLDVLGQGEAKPGALLAPQGKILFDFLVSRSGADSFRLDCRGDIADEFVRRLMLYRLRARVEIIRQDQSVMAVSWETCSAGSQIDSTASSPDPAASQADSTRARDLRFGAGMHVSRHYGKVLPVADSTPEAWHRLRIEHGIAESGSDYELGDAFPHDVLLDEMGGVGFRKGCYVGQEVVSRMQHRGTARRRVVIAQAESGLPASGTAITVQDRPVGALGTVSGGKGLAIVRVDRVKEASDAGTPILAGGLAVRLSIPSWAKLAFPADFTGTGKG